MWQGLLLSGFVMACELFAAKNRTFAGIMIENFWSVATCSMALLAYLVRDWVYLQLIISLFGLLTIPLFWYAIRCVIYFIALFNFVRSFLSFCASDVVYTLKWSFIYFH